MPRYTAQFSLFFVYCVLVTSKVSHGMQNTPLNINPVLLNPNYGRIIPAPLATEREQTKCAFLKLLSMLDTITLPKNIKLVKERLFGFVKSEQLDVFHVMRYIKNYNTRSDFDGMIAALLTLKDTLPTSCPIGNDIGNLILFSVFNKFLLDSSSHHTDQLCKKLHESSQVKTCTNCEAYKHIESLKNTLCSYYRMLNEPDVILHEETASPNTSKRLLIEPSMRTELMTSSIDTAKLLSLLPEPNNLEEINNLNMLKSHFEGAEVASYIQTLDSSQYKNDKELLSLVLKYISETNISIGIRQIATQYLQFTDPISITKPPFNFSLLTEYLPLPISKDEDEMYGVVKKFFIGNEIHRYLPDISDRQKPSLRTLYKQVLETLKDNIELDQTITTALKYYYDYDNWYDDIELQAHKVLEKRFNLKKVFSSIFTNLSPKRTTDLKLLVRFISKYPARMNSFEIPAEVQTYAQLGNAILQFLSKSPHIPDTLKPIIEELIPLIEYSGNGAELI